MRYTILIFIALSLASCAELHWQKPGADATSLAQDTASCRAVASETIARRYGPPLPAMPTMPDARFGPETSLPGPADRRLLEQQAVDRCMREKGYTLAPAEK